MNKDTDPYVYSDTNILKNIPGILDKKKLSIFERINVVRRLNELNKNKKLINQTYDLNHLKSIHKYLFQDVYTWAGKYRTRNISKEGKVFHSIQFFQHAEYDINNSLEKAFQEVDKYDIDSFSAYFSTILNDINYLHPFREGNGRTQREFIRQCAEAKGLTLNHKDYEDLYYNGTVKDDEHILEKYLLKVLSINKRQ